MIGTPGGTPERPALFFRDAAEFGRWLEHHHATETELWMGFYRKGHPEAGLTWPEAVREALCWGWIDSMAQGIDEHTRRQRWTPRKKGSNWSAININAVAELAAQGRMKPAGLAAFELRREDRSGIYAYETRDLELEAVYAAALAADPAATAFWDAATPGYRKIAVNWVMTAKQEKTRSSRMAQLVDDSAAGLMIRPQRYGTPPSWVARAAAAASSAAARGAAGGGIPVVGADGILVVGADGILVVGAGGIPVVGAGGIPAVGADGIPAVGADGIPTS